MSLKNETRWAGAERSLLWSGKQQWVEESARRLLAPSELYKGQHHGLKEMEDRAGGPALITIPDGPLGSGLHFHMKGIMLLHPPALL